MHSLLQDLRFGIRILLRSPGISAAMIFALTLGIGANSAMFSVVDALVIHPLRYQDPSTLVALWNRDPQGTIHQAASGNFLDWRSQAKSLRMVAGWNSTNFSVTGLDEPQTVSGAKVSADFFNTLGVKPFMGRTFISGDDGLDPGTSPSRVAVIGYDFWRQTLGSDPNVLGRTIILNEAPYAVVGVMPPDFQFIVRRNQIWIPLVLSDPSNRDYQWITVVARRTVPRETAAAEMITLGHTLAERYPKSNRGWTIQTDNFQEWLVDRRFRTRLLLLFAAVGMVLLLACTNVASLLFARSSVRTREIGVRVSLGASPARIVRQLLTESVLLALISGALGLGLASLLIDAAPSVIPANAIPTTAPIQLSPLVLLFTVGIAVLTGVLFGLAPAVNLSRTDIRETLNDSSRGSTGGPERQRFRQAMVTVEVALALVLLASATLMTESLRRLGDVDLGFDSKNVLTLRIVLDVARYDAAQALRFHRLALERIGQLPGVESVATGSNLPLSILPETVPFDLDTEPVRDQVDRPSIGYTSITPGYLHTLGIPLKHGRDFSQSDHETAPPVAMVNEAFATLYYPHQDPIGQFLRVNRAMLDKKSFADTVRVQIVGVTGSVKSGDPGGPPDPVLYVPLAQSLWSQANWLAVKTRADPSAIATAVRREMKELDRDQAVAQMSSMNQILSSLLAEPRFQSQVMIGFAALALVLAVVGIYGVNSYAVTQRRREIGVRIALGASPADVLRDTIGQGMKLTGAGIVLGLVGTLALSSVLRSILVGVSATDPVMLLEASAFLAAVAATACYFPAHRATRIDPASALRQD